MLKQEVSSLKQMLRNADEEITDLNVDLNGITKDLSTAINQLDDFEQYTRKHNLEIHGISETPGEIISEKIIKLGKVVNVHISNNDIDICHRMATRRANGDPRSIIVRFKSYRAKNELYRVRKHLKSPVTISIIPEDKHEKRGPGCWKFNNSVLESEEFTTKMSFIIKHAAGKHKDIADKRLYWEMLKMEIRMFAIRFAKTKSNADRNIELDVHQKLEKITLRIDATPENNSLANEARILKLELDEIAARKTRGAIIRSRARWYELGEKCIKYFFNLAKRSYEKRHNYNKIKDL